MSDLLPKLRLLNLRWVQWEGQPVLLLQDPLQLGESAVMVPRPIVPLLELLDGTRDLHALRTGYLLRTGMHILPDRVESFVENLDDAFLLENRRFLGVLRETMLSYRAAPHRAPALAGGAYPDDGTELFKTLGEYCQKAEVNGTQPAGRLVGLISPHIDYARGWRTYAETWQRAREAVEAADLVILLGTDHNGTPGSMTLTSQNYATPWGTLPTDTELVDRLANILGPEWAFAEEVHHIGEHSIELAAVWLHYVADGKPSRLLPILCGVYDADQASADGDTAPLCEALGLLAEVAAGPRVLVVAAGDLSHVGPAFGDSLPLDLSSKARVRARDERWLDVACSGSSDLLAEHIQQHGDHTRICGAAPIHYMLAVLRKAQGRVVAYDQCPADEEFGSLVSVAGALFTV